MNTYINSMVSNDSETILNEGMKIQLYDYQKTEIKKMLKLDNNRDFMVGGISSMYMGLGKSPTSLAHFIIRKQSVDKPSLIICNNCMLQGWEIEINKFLYTNNENKYSCKYIIFHKNYKTNNNIELDKSKGIILKSGVDITTLKNLGGIDLVITSYDMITKYAKEFNLIEKNIVYDDKGKNIGITNAQYPKFKGTGFKLLFSTVWNSIYLDESHKICNPKSVVFNSVMCLYGLTKWCLTGTPIRNYSPDLFSQFRFLGFNQKIDIATFSSSDYEYYNMSSRILFKNYSDIDVKLEINIPQSVEHVEFLELSANESKLYNYYKQKSKTIYKGYVNGDYNYINIFAMLTKLRQLSVCPYIISTMNKPLRNSRTDVNQTDEESISTQIYNDIPNELKSLITDINSSFGIFSTKIVRVIEILNQFPHEKFLIFANFKKVFDVLKLAVESFTDKKCSILTGDVKGKTNRNKAIQNFKEDCDVFLINYKIGGESLTLVEASHVILLEHWWNDSTPEQCIGRAMRVGQTKTVHVWKLYIKNSIEEDILNICKRKSDLSKKFLYNQSFKNSDLIKHLIK